MFEQKVIEQNNLSQPETEFATHYFNVIFFWIKQDI